VVLAHRFGRIFRRRSADDLHGRLRVRCPVGQHPAAVARLQACLVGVRPTALAGGRVATARAVGELALGVEREVDELDAARIDRRIHGGAHEGAVAKHVQLHRAGLAMRVVLQHRFGHVGVAAAL